MKRSTLSAIRYGYGLSPNSDPLTQADQMIDAAVLTSRKKPRVDVGIRQAVLLKDNEARKANDQDARKKLRQEMNQNALRDMRHQLINAVTDQGFGERLVHFWTDHFSVSARIRVLRVMVPDLVDNVIRPSITGRFADMLKGVVQHPTMLIYLTQNTSVGPNSTVGKKQNRGLNENLAREILELQTLGVGAEYSQADVEGLASLLTGLSVGGFGFKYRANFSEPGPHTVLGRVYGKKQATLADIEDALNDIALHPDTARHLSQKLIIHFLGQANPDLTERMAQAYLASGGELTALYDVLLSDDFAWEPTLRKAKLPFEFIVSSVRAAGATPDDINALSPKEFRDGVVRAMEQMGQTMFAPPGPDGWSEDPTAWITPPGLAARIRWASAFAERIEATHDPRAFLKDALADAASDLLTFAVGGSESRAEGIALTLVSPEFNRR